MIALKFGLSKGDLMCTHPLCKKFNDKDPGLIFPDTGLCDACSTIERLQVDNFCLARVDQVANLKVELANAQASHQDSCGEMHKLRNDLKEANQAVDIHLASMRSAVVTLGFDPDKNIVEAANEIGLVKEALRVTEVDYRITRECNDKLKLECERLRELARAPVREWLDKNPNEQIKALWEENKKLDEENEKFRIRLQIDPGGSDKIDELEEAMNHLRFQNGELTKQVQLHTGLHEKDHLMVDKLTKEFIQSGPHGDEARATVIWCDDEQVTQKMWDELKTKVAELEERRMAVASEILGMKR